MILFISGEGIPQFGFVNTHLIHSDSLSRNHLTSNWCAAFLIQSLMYRGKNDHSPGPERYPSLRMAIATPGDFHRWWPLTSFLFKKNWKVYKSWNNVEPFSIQEPKILDGLHKTREVQLVFSNCLLSVMVILTWFWHDVHMDSKISIRDKKMAR